MPRAIDPERLYHAYAQSAEWKNFQGAKMPKWDELPPAICRHWAAVARCAEREHETIGADDVGSLEDVLGPMGPGPRKPSE